MSDKCTWGSYEFTVFLHDGTNWNDVGGVYIFCGLNQQKKWEPYYIGQADSFQRRLPSHERWEEARRLGASHVHARSVQQEDMRAQIERELVETYKPTLNVQLK